MISKLALKNVGPLPDREYRFGRRINALTGDNGLGKTFLLDLIWFAFSNEWPVFANPAMTTGNMARPARMDVKATLSYGICPGSKTNGTLCRLEFDRESQQWEGRGNNPKETGCVVYSLSDGSFCVWDPIRNGRKQRNRPNYDPSLVVTPHEVWQGQQKFDRSNVGGSKTYSTIQGIQADWMLWQTNPNSKELPVLKQLLEKISPDGMPIGIGEPQKVSLEEARVMPTLRFPYGDVPINLASAAFRRILTLAYILVWTYSEHVKASAFVGKKPTRRIVLLVDELDAHLVQHQRQQDGNGERDQEARDAQHERVHEHRGKLAGGEQLIEVLKADPRARADAQLEVELFKRHHNAVHRNVLEDNQEGEARKAHQIQPALLPHVRELAPQAGFLFQGDAAPDRLGHRRHAFRPLIP